MTGRSRKKRILVVCQHYWPETFRVTDICEGFVENGYDVDVLCGTPNYPSGTFFPGYGLFGRRRERHNGVRIFRAPEIPRGNNTTFRILLNFLSFPFFAMAHVPLLLARHYDRVLVYQLSPVFMALPGIAVAKLKDVKLYIFVSDFWPHSLLSILRIRNRHLVDLITRISYWHYRQADGLIGAFKGTQTRLVSDVGIDRDKTLYVPQAPEKLYGSEVVDERLQQRFEGRFNIVFAGAINPAQSFETVLDAARQVIDAGCTTVNFIIVGDGMSRVWLEREVAERGLADHFSFEGFVPVEQVPPYQTLADVLIVALSRSSLFEYGIPAKVLSYMASGKPVVGAMDGDGQRLINDSGCGICVDSGDFQGLARAIRTLVEMEPAARAGMGALGRRYHLDHFERDYNLNRFIEFVFNDTRIPDTEYPD